MSDSKIQKKVSNICGTFKNVSHDKQAELLTKIIDEIEQFIRQ